MDKRWVVVTGASAGIGRATVERLSREGFGVLAGVLEPDALGLFEAAPGVVALPLDVTAADSVAAFCSRANERTGGTLWGLVNNAGVAVIGPTESLPLDELRRQFEVNFFGCVALTQRLLPMLLAGGGRIVNISSMFGTMSLPFAWPYCASKHALEAWTSGLRMELCRTGVRVVTVRPGSVRTAIWEGALANLERLFWGLPRERHAKYFKMMERLVRVGTRSGERGLLPQDVAARVARALTARSPRSIDSVGLDALGYAALRRLLGGSAMEALTIRRLHANRTEAVG
jgi:NAD(P)-dependent dehydrogenase (short-subunit alcohol dehydrogenase family)